MNEGTPSGPAAPGPDSTSKPLGDVIAINEGLIKDHLNKVVVKTVEETLNAMLDAEADQLCGAKRYEHSPDRVDTRAGHYALGPGRSATMRAVHRLASSGAGAGPC
jgi:hypothetical protein